MPPKEENKPKGLVKGLFAMAPKMSLQQKAAALDVAHAIGICDPSVNLDKVEARHFVRNPLAAAYFALGTRCKSIAEEPFFQGFINVCILIASGLVGLAAEMQGVEGSVMEHVVIIQLENVLKALFAFELFLKFTSYRLQPWAFFGDGWNRLDFAVVGGSFIPSVGALALLLRMVRLFRVLKALKVQSIHSTVY
jgi:hypothetical protein